MTLRLVSPMGETPPLAPRRRGPGQEPRPFPIQTLERALRWPPVGQLALRLAVNPRQVYKWRETGLTARQADVLAIRCNLHPTAVWNDW